MPPAGLVLSLVKGAMGRTAPSTRACGVATLPPSAAAEWRTLLSVHAHFFQDALGDEILPRQAGHGLDDLARDEVEDVVVGVGAAERRRRLDVPEAARDVSTVVGRLRPPEQVPGAEAEPAAVDEEVADAELAGDVGIVHHEPGQVVDDGRVPGDLAFLDEQAEGRRREDLGVGGDAEEGPRVDRGGIAQLPDAVALGQDDAAVLDDGQREAGDFEGLHDPGDRGVDPGRNAGRRPGLGRGRGGVPPDGHQERQQNKGREQGRPGCAGTRAANGHGRPPWAGF